MGDGWRGAPHWAVDLLEQQYIMMCQLEEIQAEMQDRSTRLSDKDQKALDKFVNILKGTNEKIDGAKQDE